MTTIQTTPPSSAKKASLRTEVSLQPSEWQGYEKLVFRFFFIYFFIQAVPLDWKFYQSLFSIDWLHLHYRDIFYLSRYFPQFVPGQSFVNWGIVALIALAGTVVWSLAERRKINYDALLYGLRVIVRYRLAIGIIAYGFIKLFPLQAPLPSLSNLNTNYGDFTDWKLFSLSLGIVPNYESFLGLAEITAGVLLLFRRTTLIGTLVILPFTGNVFMSNLAYSGGEYVYSFYLITLALFLLSFDALRLYNLFTLERPTLPNRYRPAFTEKWQQQGRIALKGTFLFVVLLYGYKTYAGYLEGPYQYPQKAGLANASGLYNVREFRINNRVLPYSPNDPIRWKDVVFEKWATLSIRSNRPVQLETTSTEEIFLKDDERNYEFAGTAGRHYYSYEIDQAQQVLLLKHRNKNYPQEKLILHYSRPNTSQIILAGINEKNDSIYVLLEKINKKYLLEEVAREGRQKSLKL
jgi:hypothetical protein